jgi:hypothetical protein
MCSFQRQSESDMLMMRTYLLTFSDYMLITVDLKWSFFGHTEIKEQKFVSNSRLEPYNPTTIVSRILDHSLYC